MKYALIIGNDQYDDPKLAQLKTPAADSQALAKALADKSIGSFDEVTPLINKNETEIRRAISGFLTSKKPDDLVLVYFSGHGVLDDRGRLFLSLKDTQTNLLKATAIPSSYIADEMDTCRSKRQILILDCCHSGAFARGTKGDQKAVTEATFEGSGFGRVVLTASDSTQYALEGDQVIAQTDLSLFTHFLLEGLSTGEADQNNDGFISLDEWYDYTYTRVISTTPKQVPHKWSYHQQGDMLIAKNPFVKKKVVELPKEMLAALESPFASIREGAVKELGKYLNSKDSDLIELARLALKKMKDDDSRLVSVAADTFLAGNGEATKNAKKLEEAHRAIKSEVNPVVNEAQQTTKENHDSVLQAARQPELLNKIERVVQSDKNILNSEKIVSSQSSTEAQKTASYFIKMPLLAYFVTSAITAFISVALITSANDISIIYNLFLIIFGITCLVTSFYIIYYKKAPFNLGTVAFVVFITFDGINSFTFASGSPFPTWLYVTMGLLSFLTGIFVAFQIGTWKNFTLIIICNYMIWTSFVFFPTDFYGLFQLISGVLSTVASVLFIRKSWIQSLKSV